MSIDLSQLPAPELIEELDYETILAQITELFVGLYPDHILLESDPATKLLQVAAYRELLVRQRINQNACSSLVYFATGSDLDHVGAPFTFRKENESDDEYRARIPLSMHTLSTAGPTEAYRAIALGAYADTKKVKVNSPEKGLVQVVLLLCNDANKEEAIAVTKEALCRNKKFPITDDISVIIAEPIDYAINATLVFESSANQEISTALANASLQSFLVDRQNIGSNIRIKAIEAALAVEGVSYATVNAPAEDIICASYQVANCIDHILASGGIDE